MILSLPVLAQEYDWVKFFKGSSWQLPAGMQIDKNGNQYAAFVCFNGEITVDSQKVNTRNLILKQDSSGKVIWYKGVTTIIDRYGSTSILGTAFTTGGRFAAIIASRDSGIVVGSDTIMGQNIQVNNQYNIFLTEFDTSGKLTYGSNLILGSLNTGDYNRYVTSNKITIDDQNNLTMSLQFADSFYVFDQKGSYKYSDYNRATSRIFKFNSAGRQLDWVTAMPSGSSFRFTDMDVDINGDIYLSASFKYNVSDTSLISNNGFSLTNTTSPYDYQGGVFVFDTSGRGKTNFYLRGSHSLALHNIVAHDSDGVFLSGDCRGDTFILGTFNHVMPSNISYHFFCRANSNGDIIWFKHEDTSYTQTFPVWNDQGCMTNFADEYIYLSYRPWVSTGTIKYDGLSFPVPPGRNYSYGITLKIDHLGNILWGLRTRDAPFKGMGTDAASSFYFQGHWVRDTVKFGPFQSYTNTSQDAFIGKTSDYSIFRGDVSSGPYCAGDTLLIPYTKFGNYLDSNEFIAELSDEYGNFTGGQRELGRISSTEADTIAGILPLFSVASSGQYRIRILSTNPQVQSFYRLDTLNLLIYSRDSANPGGSEWICSGDTLMLTNTGGTKWQWSPSYAMNDSTLRQPMVWPDTTTEYTIIIADSSGCGAPDTSIKVVHVRDKPAIKASFSDTTVCPSDTIDLKIIASGGDSSTYTVSWYKQAIIPQRLIHSSLISGNRDSISASGVAGDTGGTRYFALLSDSCGTYTDTAQFIVRSYNPLQIKLTPKDTVLCRSDSITLKPIVTGGRNSTYAYKWFDQSGTLKGFSREMTVNTSYGDSGMLHVAVSDACMLFGDTTEFDFKFYSPLESDIFHNGSPLSDTILCFDDSLEIYSGIRPFLSNALTYQWSINGRTFSSSDRFVLHPDSIRQALGISRDSALSAKIILRLSSLCEIVSDSAQIRLLPESGNAVQSPIASVINSNMFGVYFNTLPRPNVQEYRLYKIQNTGRSFIDSASFGGSVQSFTFNDTLGMDQANCYQIETIDSCGNVSFSDTFCTQKLRGMEDQLHNDLSWDLDDGLIPFKIWLWNGTSWDSIGSFSSTDSNFIHKDLRCKNKYTYRLSFTQGSGIEFYTNAITLEPFDTLPPTPPSRLDVSVNTDRTIQLYWPASISSDVEYYEIWRHNSTGSFQVDSITRAQFSGSLQLNDTLYLSGVNCYYLVTTDSCGNVSFSDTFCSQQLNGMGDQLHNDLSWDLDDGLLPDKVWLWNGINYDSIGVLKASDSTFIHSNLQCNREYRYRLSFTSSLGGEYFTNTITLQPYDTIAPAPPARLDVSVSTNQTTQLNWLTSSDSDVAFYEIWRDIGSGFVQIGSVADTQFVDSGVNPSQSPLGYFIVAVDSCGNGNHSVPSDTVKHIRVTASSGACVPLIRLQWESYTGFKNDVRKQRILRSTDGVNYSVIDSVDWGESRYVDSTVLGNTEYTYRIEVVSSVYNQSVFSDTSQRTPYVFPRLDPISLRYASVSGTGINGENLLAWEATDLTDTLLRGYYIWEHSNGNRSLIRDETALSTTTFSHQNTNTLDFNHTYSISVYDACLSDTGTMNRQSNLSDTHTTILLEISSRNLELELNWSTYIGFPVSQYVVERSDNGAPTTTMATLQPNDSSWIDTSVFCDHRYTYYVSAKEAGGSDVSHSNEVTATAFDTIGPKPIRIVNASVEKTGTGSGEIDLVIEGSDDRNAHQVLLYRIVDGGSAVLVNGLLDPDAGTLNYSDNGLNTSESVHRYFARAIDSCGNTGIVLDSFDIILLQTTPMNNVIRLDWTAHHGYDQWKYQVQRLTSANTWATIAELSPEERFYLDSQVICLNTYTYRILCTDESTTLFSLSNEVSESPIDTIAPKAPILLNVSVTDPNKEVMVEWTESNDRDLAGYVIQNTETGFETTLSDPFASQHQILLGNSDMQCFTIRSYDSCDNHSKPSDPICLIRPKVTALEGVNSISWAPYQFGGGMEMEHYELYVSDDTVNWKWVAQIPVGRTNFTHNDFDIDQEDFVYQIVATSDQTPSYVSYSLVSAVRQTPTLWIPSAFSPYSTPELNDKFGPKGSKVHSFTIKIWDRWGGLVYESDESIPWDGKINGEPNIGGHYAYQISVTDRKGGRSHHSGIVTLIR